MANEPPFLEAGYSKSFLRQSLQVLQTVWSTQFPRGYLRVYYAVILVTDNFRRMKEALRWMRWEYSTGSNTRNGPLSGAALFGIHTILNKLL